MAASAALRQDVPVVVPPASPSRNAIIARYRRLRAVSRQHHRRMQDFISQSALLQQAQRIGLAEGRTLILADPEEMSYALDLAIHTAPADRSRAIDRYARAAQPPRESDEDLVLRAMRQARFSVYRVARRHEAAGVIVEDTMRETELWLMDEGLEASVPDGHVMASRLYAPESFWMTTGVQVPVHGGLLLDLADEAPQLFRCNPCELADDRRFAQAIYRIGLGQGLMRKVRFQDVPEDVTDADAPPPRA